MREIIPGRVWIGNARDAKDVAGILEKEIEAVVHLAIEEPPSLFPREITYCRFPLLDGEGNSPTFLKTAIQTVSMLIKAKVPILVTCSGGMSRSPAIVAAAISDAKDESLDEWLMRIAGMGPHDIAPALWNDIRLCTQTVD